ncbi:MAG TPA: hypothetical protein EYP17_09230 [Candidatus Latescibacteria bacterium]|nr:hypothetical protein [Candidatus Latescibacterota bacterium]
MLIFIFVCLLSSQGTAGEYVVPRDLAWEEWTYPEGLLDFGDDGSIGLRWFRRDINPIENAGEFEHETVERGRVRGGVRAGSNGGNVRYITDGRIDTYWKPRPEDPIEDWWVEVDLGRVVLAKKVRLSFPDTVGARPFRDFSIYVSEGANLSGQKDLFRFIKVGTTTKPNAERVVEYELLTVDQGMATGENLVTSDTLDFMAVQYIRFVSHAKSPDAALAEIEVRALGDNIALGTVRRGGSIRAGGKFAAKAPALFDGTVDRYWNVSAARAAEAFWKTGGQWFEWDLGAVFWLDQIVILSWPARELGKGQFLGGTGALGYALFTSDGTRLPTAGGERIEGNFDYQLLSLVDNRKTPRRWKFNHVFPCRKVRYIFYHHEYGTGRYGYNIFEIMLYSQGHPAEVEMTSPFIDLGGVKSLLRVEWDADVPPGTKVGIRTRTGDTLKRERYYYLPNGQKVTEEKWKSLPPAVRARGRVEEVVRPGADWSPWSNLYKTSGEDFLSPTPRRFVQIKVCLSTDDPAVAPRLRRISLSYHDPLVRGGVVGEITPREAELGVPVSFSYRIKPEPGVGDLGFDRVVIKVPSPTEEVSVEVGGKPVSASYSISGDSLVVMLPYHVKGDSVVVRFRARVFRDATYFDAFVLSSRKPGIWQGVKPAEQNATLVFLPSVPSEAELIRMYSIEPEAITPDGDGRNDLATVKFHIVKTDRSPKVEIYDLKGQLVRELERGEGYEYLWDGRDGSGRLVPPGAYVCRVRVDADMGSQSASRLVCVVY